MKFQILGLFAASLALFGTGCETPWYSMEPVADSLIPPTNPFPQQSDVKSRADTVGKPADVHFFGDHAVYMGDKDGYRYVHVRDIFEFWGFLGECDYLIPENDWPMKHPMPLTTDATLWQDVTWLNGDGPKDIPQDAFLHITPAFPLGAPATQPALMPTPTDNFSTRPAPETSSTEPTAPTSAPTSSPATQVVPSATAPTEPTTEPQSAKVLPPTTQPASQP
jgi:hypothetical protein